MYQGEFDFKWRKPQLHCGLPVRKSHILPTCKPRDRTVSRVRWCLLSAPQPQYRLHPAAGFLVAVRGLWVSVRVSLSSLITSSRKKEKTIPKHGTQTFPSYLTGRPWFACLLLHHMWPGDCRGLVGLSLVPELSLTRDMLLLRTGPAWWSQTLELELAGDKSRSGFY